MNVYLDNAATTPLNPAVIEVMTNLLQSTSGNPSSIHQAGRKARTIVEDARKRVAKQLNASIGEIFFTSSATESNNMALFCAVRDLGIERIISSPTEHPCVLNTLAHLQQVFGTEVVFLNVDEAGNIDCDELENHLKKSAASTLTSLMHGNNEIGTIHDIISISNICQQYESLFHSDAVQTVGKYQHDLNDVKVSFLSASGHKIYGPKGVGILYINSDNMIEAYIKGGGQERSLRSGTENIYGIAGFAESMDWFAENRDLHSSKTCELRNYMKEQLDGLDIDVRYNGNQDANYLCNILSLSIPKSDRSEMIMFNLDIHGICASAGSACSSGAEQQSHVISAIGAPTDRKTIRFSLSHMNTKEEIDYVIEKFRTLV